MHVIVTTRASFPGDLIGFTTSLLITLLLLVLTLRAAKLPGTPAANLGFAACAVLWSAAGLINAAFTSAGMPHSSPLAIAARAVQLIAAAAFPLPILLLWQSFAALAWQKTAARVVLLLACVSAAIVSIFQLSGLTVYHAALFLLSGFAISLRPRSTMRAVYVPSLGIVLAVCTAATARAGVGTHLAPPILLCSLFLFARFRYADVFIRYGVRILIAGLWALALAFLMHSVYAINVASRSPSPAALHVFMVILLSNALLLSFTFVDERIGALVNRWLFHPPDYRAQSRRLSVRLRALHLETEIAAAVEDAVRTPLQLSGARLVALDTISALPWPRGTLEGEAIELHYADPLRGRLPIPDVELLVPVASGGSVSHALLISPGAARPGLVTEDLHYLAGVAAQCGGRLDALRRERESVERQSREALLLQQVTEAELRALRAQINPHFLFNSLNTIADLIVRDPPRAETMTLRLASVFRHVLDHSSRPLTSIRDEMDFLRTYLYIEEARFGDRLQVSIQVAPEVEREQIPSLILQPLVENALKHGLGPKPGPGHLWIRARASGDRIEVEIEDDGMGLNGRRTALPEGMGLANVAERIATLYRDRASVQLESREGGGARVTLLIPRSEALPCRITA